MLHETDFRWRLVLTDSAITSLPTLVNNPVQFNLYSVDQQSKLQIANSLWERIQKRQWYPLIKNVVASLPTISDLSHTEDSSMSQDDSYSSSHLMTGCQTSKTTESSESLESTDDTTESTKATRSSKVKEPPPSCYPSPYVHRVPYINGYSNSAKDDPLKRVQCFYVSDDGLSYILQSVDDAIESMAGKDPRFEEHLVEFERD